MTRSLPESSAQDPCKGRVWVVSWQDPGVVFCTRKIFTGGLLARPLLEIFAQCLRGRSFPGVPWQDHCGKFMCKILVAELYRKSLGAIIVGEVVTRSVRNISARGFLARCVQVEKLCKSLQVFVGNLYGKSLAGSL